MAPFTKENEVLTVAPQTAGVAASATDSRLEDRTSKPQPVALEVPVTVNGARPVEGSDKREPFSETTKTVLVFGNGAVIRLGSPVAAGQLLFLTNEKTKKEVVCQVVKSKNYKNVSGYVELEFTESVVGFWGMRFPGDRIGGHTPAPATPVATKSVAVAPISVAPKAPSPAVSATPKTSELHTTPAPPVVASGVQARPGETKTVVPFPMSPVATPTQAPSASASTPLVTKIPESPAIPAPSMSAGLTSSLASLLSPPEALPALNPATLPAPLVSSESKQKSAEDTAENSSEELKLQAARLQEQLSSLLFSAASAPTSAPPVPGPDPKAVSGIAAKVFEMAKTEPVSPKVVPPAKLVPPLIKSSLDTEEVKIPSWLEPLARNAAASTPARESLEKEKSKHAAEIAAHEEHSAKPVSVAETASAPEVELPAIGNLLPLDEEVAQQEGSAGGWRKGLLLGAIAAGLLLAAGGGWYLYHPTNSSRGTSPPTRAEANISSIATATAPATSQPATQNAPETTSRSNEAPISGAPATSERLPQSPNSALRAPVIRDDARGSASTIPAAATERISRPAPQPEIKKPALGEVHLATPTVNRPETAQDEQVVAPTISTNSTNANSDGIASGLAAGSEKQPAAPEVPLPIGGDVKPARLLSEAAPVYPIMAKNQHVTGDVVIDALIDANGRVTTMKVISGPTLLHQAAKDALKQWKYQPASLDGKPVSMHLTVTLQFRMP